VPGLLHHRVVDRLLRGRREGLRVKPHEAEIDLGVGDRDLDRLRHLRLAAREFAQQRVGAK